ncbi:hypothetical protein BGX27_009269 [Mortierella sp. AM989]|nr:hypothetical protein BGX27_009269 [Mortierella sp. AM989]
MNTAKPYDQHQQQGYRPPPGSHKPTTSTTSTQSISATIPAMGRPLPKAPALHQQQQLDPSIPTSTSLTSFPSNSSYQNIASTNNSGPYLNATNTTSNNSNNKNATLSSARVNIHISQPSATSNNINPTTNANSNTGSYSRNVPWIQPKVSSSASSFSTIQTTLPTGVNSNVGSAYTNTLLGKKNQQYLGHSQQLQSQSQPKLTQEEETSYYAALTRPISPTMIMNYIPPPSSSGGNSSIQSGSTIESSGHPILPPVSSTISPSTNSSLRPHSVTAALSSSFNTLGPGSQAGPKPVIHQGARSSYIHPSTTVSSPGSVKPQQGSNATVIDAEDPASNSSRFARRGPLVVGHDVGSFVDNTRSRRGSAAYSDSMDSPATNQHRHQFQTQQQSFSPSSQRTDGPDAISPTSIESGVQQQIAKEGWLWRRGNLLTWKRCYAIGRYRGDANPGILTLFKDNEHLFPIKTIDMAECFEVQVKGQDAKATGRFEFKVVTRKEETWFATDTMSERTGWIDALNSLMAKAVGASLMKLEAKLNNIRQRNNSLEYAHTAAGVQSTEKATMLEEQLHLVQQDLVTREQLLSQREQELERKRVESLLVQLEAWRAAAKVTVNQHYSVRDQLLERVMKTARTVQELIERARIHLETGSDQITEVVNSHFECLKVHASESAQNATSYKMLKSILVGLTVNLDTRSSEMKRVLLVLDQYIGATKSSTSTSTPSSPILALSPTSLKDRRMSVGASFHSSGPPPAPSASMGVSVYLIQVRDKYRETLEILEDHSKRLKRVLERADINNPETARRFHEEAKDMLKGLLKLPSYVFAPCLPDQPLPGAADTFYREDLVQIQQKSKELLRKSQTSGEASPLQQTVFQPIGLDTRRGESEVTEEQASKEEPALKALATPVDITDSTKKQASATSANPAATPKLSLALPASLSSFLLPDNNAHAASTMGLTQKLRDTILPEFDHLSIKQEESLQSMTSLLNQISSILISKLAEIKDATAGQRQEFEELKDEIIDVMQLSATDPSAHQRDISALSEIRSKLAEITEQLTKVQTSNGQTQHGFYGSGNSAPYNGNRRLMDQNGNSNAARSSAAIKTGYSLLQRSASTMAPSSFGGAHPFYHTVDSGSRQHLQRVNSTSLQNRLQMPSSTSMAAGYTGAGLASLVGTGVTSPSTGVGKHPKIAGMARLFEDGGGLNANEDGRQPPTRTSYLQDYEYDQDSHQYPIQNQEVVSKLDQLLLLLEFVNTAQCRMMAYQDLEFDRSKDQNSSNVDDGRMMAVQEHMEQMDRKMNLQMHLLRKLVSLQTSDAVNVEEPHIASDAQIQEIKDEEVSEETRDEIDTDQLASASDMSAIKPIARKSQTDDDLSFIEVLNRLDLQVIPFVKDQSNQINELSDQLSDMRRQLDEQQRRQEQISGAPPRLRVATLNNLDRSNSVESPTTSVLHSRSQSQTLVQQQTNPLSSAAEIDSPASWRSSLRPSPSTGSNSAAFRERASSASNGSTPLSSSSSIGSQSNLQDGYILSKTTDRIAEILDRMDSKMGQVIDEQLSRYEQGNRELLAKVYELLETDDEAAGHAAAEEHRGSREGANAVVASNAISSSTRSSAVVSKSDLSPITQKLQGIEQILTAQNDQSELQQVGNKALWKEIVTSLDELHGHQTISTQSQQQWAKDVKETLDQVLKGQEELSSKNGTLDSQDREARHDNDTAQGSVGSIANLDLTESFEKLKSLIQQEADRSEFSLNEQRDELLEKMNHIMSSIQESQADVGSRDAAVKEELQEMREWIVKHSSMQTENLREIVFAATTGHASGGTDTTIGTGISSRSVDSDRDSVVIAGNGSGCGSEEEYTQVDILDDLDQESIIHSSSHMNRQPTQNQNQSPATATKEIQELKDQLEMFTKIQMATYSELADNVSGVEKMMRDMSKMMGVRRGGTIQRKKEADQDRAMLAAEVKGTIEEVMTRMNSSPSISSQSGAPATSQKGSTSRSSLDNGDGRTSPLSPTTSTPTSGLPRGESGLLKYLYQPRRLSSIVTTGTSAQQYPRPPSPALSSSPSPAAVSKASAVAARTPMTVNTSFSQAEVASMRPPLSARSSTTDCMEDEDQAHAMEAQLDLYHGQMEQLYRRKARVEIEVEDLQSEKSKLTKEKEELKSQVEQLRQEKQDLLLSRRSGSSEETIVEQSSTTATILEKALSDRVAMLLQETARLEALKKQLESETA